MFSSNATQVSSAANYIEDVFNTYLYTGTGATQTITNGINLSANGGLVWSKVRSTSASHALSDTANGVSKYLSSDTISAISSGFGVTAFNTDGFNSPAFAGGSSVVSWTFREQPKFFDVVTFTQTGNTGYTTVNHNLGSVPGCIIMKCTSTASTWAVYHRSIPLYGLSLSNTWDTSVIGQPAAIDVTSTEFKLNNTDWGANNSATWVAYVYAHNAGGFGLTGTDNVISCGSFSTVGSGKMSAAVNLGYEPQWLLVKNYGASENWVIYDNMRGMSNTGYAALNPNSSGAEYTGTSAIAPTATGFDTPKSSGPFADFSNYIYIAIRRGPMKVPTVGTSVYNTATDIAANAQANVGFPADMTIMNRLSGGTHVVNDRLRGSSLSLYTDTTAVEGPFGTYFDSSIGFWNGNGSGYHYYGTPNFTWAFRRAPSFFDEVCYTGTGSATTQTHNLGVVPELIITKVRSGGPPDFGWAVYASPLGATKALFLDTTDAEQTLGAYWNDTAPTSSVFTVGNANKTNRTSYTYVAYLFATCAGVSKVGTYTGTGATQTINCGFGAGGSRFVLIKRTDSTGDWYVWDSARGMVSGTDPSLLLNTTAAEVNANSVYTISTGFQIVSTAAGINASGGTYIFLAIA